ncbi:hypothetical protein T08_14426 [Trichinella sp. T8]|nr:hypothetical protein T08_14426 [Trichinella sp. T8]
MIFFSSLSKSSQFKVSLPSRCFKNSATVLHLSASALLLPIKKAKAFVQTLGPSSRNQTVLSSLLHPVL